MRVRHRLLAWLVVIGVAGAALVAVGSAALIRAAVRDGLVHRLRVDTALLSAWVEQEPAAGLQAFAERAGDRLGMRVTLVAADGRVLADSSLESAGVLEMDNHAERPEIRAARTRGSAELFRTSATTHVEYLYAARVVPGGHPVRYVRLAIATHEVLGEQQRYVWLLVGLVPAAMLLLATVGYAAVRRLSRPIEHMALAVERSARGDRSLELPVAGGEEVERLGAAVRQMREQLVEQLDQLGAERSLLAGVVEGVHEGLVVVGADGHVRLANRSARQTLEVGFDPVGHPLASVVRHPTVLRDVELGLASGAEVVEPILQLRGGRSFQLRVTPLERTKGVIVLFLDVTRLEKLEGVRREFVANVSHELRTPLTSIKAFTETLLDGGLADAENAARFLGIVRKHADRMGALIDDLTDLSLIETGAIALHPEDVDAAEVVRAVLEHLQPLAARRDVRLDSELGARFPVRADRRRLEQMLTNLVDNAIKFSHPGGRVRVLGACEPSGTVVAVADEGIGIPAESLEKVFHRFYQEQRDESRDAGGTGLGLSIVKHLMRLHGGTVSVESELGRGSTFRLEFPGPA